MLVIIFPEISLTYSLFMEVFSFQYDIKIVSKGLRRLHGITKSCCGLHRNIKNKEGNVQHNIWDLHVLDCLTCSSSAIAPLNSAPRNINFSSSSVTYGSLRKEVYMMHKIQKWISRNVNPPSYWDFVKNLNMKKKK